MLNIDPYTILWTLIDLLILFLLMKKFLFKPVNNILDARAKAIEETRAEAERQQKDAEELRRQYEEKMAQSHREAEEILSQAKARGEELYQKTVDDAQSKSKRLMAESQQRNAHDRETMLKSLREEVASLVVEAAAKVAADGDEALDQVLKEEQDNP